MSDLREVDGELVSVWGEEFGTFPELLPVPSETCPPERRGVQGSVNLGCDEEVGHCSITGGQCYNEDDCPPEEECILAVEPGSRGFYFDTTDCDPIVFTNPGGSGGLALDYSFAIQGCEPLEGGSDEVQEGDYFVAQLAVTLQREDGFGTAISIPVTSITGVFTLGAPADYNGFLGIEEVKVGTLLPAWSGHGQAYLAYLDQSNPGGEYWVPGCRYKITWLCRLETYKADDSPGNYAIELVDPEIPVQFLIDLSEECLPMEPLCELP